MRPVYVDPYDGLKDFQRRTAEHAFRRLFLDSDSTRRFLVADETGLGKTIVARGLIARTIEHLREHNTVKRIDVVYVCSNSDIADQNIKKLTKGEGAVAKRATRLTLLITQNDLLHPSVVDDQIPVTLVSFTPSTSFKMGNQYGRAEERVVLFVLLSEILELGKAQKRALRQILRGGVRDDNRFKYLIKYWEELWVKNSQSTRVKWEPTIFSTFCKSFKNSPLRREVIALIVEVQGRTINKAQKVEALSLIVALRRVLADSSVKAIEPDLIILDEFQRFRSLLDDEGSEADLEARELAKNLFEQPDARVLLLSATPYKPFTSQTDVHDHEDHYFDFFNIIKFLSINDELVVEIKKLFMSYRKQLIAGLSVSDVKDQLEASLLKFMCRTERPQSIRSIDSVNSSRGVKLREPSAQEMIGYVELSKLAELIDAPMSVEYWKSSPYFANFLDGYKIREKISESKLDYQIWPEVAAALKKTKQLNPRVLASRGEIDLTHPRLQKLIEETLDKDWWKLLWVPPSLSYWAPEGPFAESSAKRMTKRLIFSSWVAAPTAIASLISYEADRRMRSAAGSLDIKEFTPRLQYRRDQGAAASHSSLMLFWPFPALAEYSDPRTLIEGNFADLPKDRILGLIQKALTKPVGQIGLNEAEDDTAWYWKSALVLDDLAGNTKSLRHAEPREIAASLVGVDASDTNESRPDLSQDDEGLKAIESHVEDFLGKHNVRAVNPKQPVDLLETLSLIGLTSPGNVAWRALRGVTGDAPQISTLGYWKAAATLADGLRSLFNRPEATNILDAVSAEDGTDLVYWRNVLKYCAQGNLQSVIDEYLYVLRLDYGKEVDTDESIMEFAQTARRALTLRAANYRAFSPDHPDTAIPFSVRFALRFGNQKQDTEDLRLPEVRAAFNSPFWPFVLASTSIGQEGVDFHWWCHAIVHWNLPSNPVDFEQREGRIDRFRGHAIRKNIAQEFGPMALNLRDNPWDSMFVAAASETKPDLGDLYPSWVFPGDAAIERNVFCLPLSKDEARWTRLQQMVVLYRLAFGQPRQDDLVQLLQRQNRSIDEIDKDQISLAPRQ